MFIDFLNGKDGIAGKVNGDCNTTYTPYYRSLNAATSSENINCSETLDRYSLAICLYELLFNKKLLDSESMKFFVLVGDNLKKYKTELCAGLNEINRLISNSPPEDIQKLEIYKFIVESLKAGSRKFTCEKPTQPGGFKKLTKNPFDYYVKKHLQSGGELRTKTQLRKFVTDTLSTRPKLRKAVLTYGT